MNNLELEAHNVSNAISQKKIIQLELIRKKKCFTSFCLSGAIRVMVSTVGEGFAI